MSQWAMAIGVAISAPENLQVASVAGSFHLAFYVGSLLPLFPGISEGCGIRVAGHFGGEELSVKWPVDG